MFIKIKDIADNERILNINYIRNILSKNLAEFMFKDENRYATIPNEIVINSVIQVEIIPGSLQNVYTKNSFDDIFKKLNLVKKDNINHNHIYLSQGMN